MHARRLIWVNILVLLTLINPLNAQDATPTLAAHEVMNIPILQNDSNAKGSDAFWSPDNHYLVVANAAFSPTEAVSSGTQYSVFSLPDGQFLFSFGGFVDWMPDSQHIVMCDVDMTDTQILDVPSGKVTMTLHGAANGWLWNADRSKVASETAAHSLAIYNLASGSTMQILPNLAAKDALWSHDSRMIAAKGLGTSLEIYDIETGMLLGQLSGDRVLAWNPDDHQLVFALPRREDLSFQLGLWTVESGKTEILDVLNTSYLWSPDGKKLAFASIDHSVHIIDTDTGVLIKKIQGFESEINLFRWDQPDRLIVITGDYGAAIPTAFEVFNIETGERILQAFFDVVTARLRITNDRFEIIQACLDLCKQVYDLKTGQQLSEGVLKTTESSSFFVDSPNFRWILNLVYPDLSNSVTEYHVHLYTVEPLAEVAVFPVNDEVKLLKWSSDSRYFVACGDQSVTVWQV